MACSEKISIFVLVVVPRLRRPSCWLWVERDPSFCTCFVLVVFKGFCCVIYRKFPIGSILAWSRKQHPGSWAHPFAAMIWASFRRAIVSILHKICSVAEFTNGITSSRRSLYCEFINSFVINGSKSTFGIAITLNLQPRIKHSQC